jgi:hypothetical protein
MALIIVNNTNFQRNKLSYNACNISKNNKIAGDYFEAEKKC